MCSGEEVAKLKKELEEMRAEFKKLRDRAAKCMKNQPKGDVEGQTTEAYGTCSPCIAWTSI